MSARHSSVRVHAHPALAQTWALPRLSDHSCKVPTRPSFQTFTPGLSRLRSFSQLQSPVVGERLFYMVANQKIVAAINEQMGNEFSAMLQYYAIAAHFGAEGL